MTAEGLVGDGDAYAQARQALATIDGALREAGAALHHVVRTRMYVTDMAHAEAVMRAHGEIFAEIRPAATLVAVSRLVDDRLLVEIEADAMIGDGPGGPLS